MANASKPRYRVAEIYIEASPEIGGMEGALEGANAMITQVKGGAPFALLAQQFSSAASAARGGDVGWVREGELRPEIDAVIKQMVDGSLSKTSNLGSRHRGCENPSRFHARSVDELRIR